jgi:DUF1009 family protein
MIHRARDKADAGIAQQHRAVLVLKSCRHEQSMRLKETLIMFPS